MKLLECYIENFGKLSKRRIVFKDGLNCIKEDNGSGKTTLAAFIKAMLYGMSDTKRASLEENDRKHYLPWQGGICGGSLTFSAGGKTYRVERSFGTKAADDTYALYDTATGRISTDFTDGVGEGLFGIDADGFERTVFLSERALTPKSENKSISAKLSDLVGCDGDIGGMDEAMKALEDKRKFYYKKGGSGEIADTRAKLDSVTRRLLELDEIEKSAEQSRDKLKEISDKIQVAKREARILLDQREAALRRAAEVNYERRYRDLKLSVEAAERQRTAVAEIFGEYIPSRAEIDDADFKRIEAKRLVDSAADESHTSEFKRLSARFDGRVEKARIEETRAALILLKNKREREVDPKLIRAKKIFAKRVPAKEELDRIGDLLNKKEKAPIGCIIGYILSAICCGLGFIIDPRLIAAGVIGVLLSTITHIAIVGRANARRNAEIYSFFAYVSGADVKGNDEARARLGDMYELLPILSDEAVEDTAELMRKIRALVGLFPEKITEDPIVAAEGIIAEYDKYAELTVAERFMAGERRSRLERAARLDAESKIFIAKFKTKTSDPFGELRRALNEYDRLTAEIVARREEMARLESSRSGGDDIQKAAEDELNLLDVKRRENEATIADLSREYTITERSYIAKLEELEEREGLLMRKEELEELLERHTERYETIQLTKKYLAVAKDNITSRYLGKTKAGFLKYAEKIGGITGESFEMDTDFSITRQDGGATRTQEAYSRGTRDLYNLAIRLALVDSLYEIERPFILLDDPFTSFDDGKTDAALRLLKELGKERQIIYFTCSKSRSV